MKEVGLVEPDHLSRRRMPLRRLADLARPQAVSGTPLEFDPGVPTELLHTGPFVGLKHLLPGHVQPFAEIADVQDSGADHSVSYGWFDPLEDSAAVRDGGLPSLRRGLLTEKPDPQRPVAGIRHLVVQRDLLMRGIFGRGVDASCDSASRSRTVRVFEERSRDRGDQLLETIRPADREAAEENRAILDETATDRIAVALRPGDEIDSRDGGRSKNGKNSFVAERHVFHEVLLGEADRRPPDGPEWARGSRPADGRRLRIVPHPWIAFRRVVLRLPDCA